MSSLLFAISLIFLIGNPAAQEEGPKKDEKNGSLPFRWVQVGSDLDPISLERPGLQKLRAYSDYAPFIQTEEEVTKVDETTTRKVTRAYRPDPNGRPRLTEVVEETLQELPGGGWKAVKVVSSADANRKLRVMRRESQEVSPVGEGAYETLRTTELASPTGKLGSVERLEQTEKRLDGGVVEIEQVQYQMGPNGRWEAQEQRVGSYRETEEAVAGRVQVFRKDAAGKLSLSEEVVEQAWQDQDGRHRTIERQAPNFDGDLEVTERITLSSLEGDDGSVTTTQETAVRPVGSESRDLKLVERITQRQVQGAGTETSVEARDVTDRMTTISSFVTTREAEGRNKTLQKVNPN